MRGTFFFFFDKFSQSMFKTYLHQGKLVIIVTEGGGDLKIVVKEIKIDDLKIIKKIY